MKSLHIPALSRLFDVSEARFREHHAMASPLREACEQHADVATFHELGESEDGRPLYGVELGRGPCVVSLIAGAHADEPVGPETLRTLVLDGLRHREALASLFEVCRFVIVPHINPDGEARNRAWIRTWPSVEAYLGEAVREAPGRDLEFGFPAMRRENRLVSSFLQDRAPFHLHMSLHGMGFSDGAMLLIERHWAFRTEALRRGFARAAEAEGLALHDHNRKGEKGFFYIEPGFTTTPEGEAMRTYFHALGEDETARHFHDSSMEYVRSLGGNPLCLVTELPLFLVRQGEARPGHPAGYLRFKEALPRLKLRVVRGEPVWKQLHRYGVRALPLPNALRLQLRALELGLEAVTRAAAA